MPTTYKTKNGLDYSMISDKELVALIVDKRNEEAAMFLIYNKYEKDLRYYAMRYYDSLEYLDELSDEVYIQLKGKNVDWTPLRSFQWRCSFRTWFCSTVSHLFFQKRKELIDLGDYSDSIETDEDGRPCTDLPAPEENNYEKVILLEAIGRLENGDYRFILIKELEGYNPSEIAQMLTQKRIAENRLRKRPTTGADIIPNAGYIYMIKMRALKEVKQLIEIIKTEWYGNK